MKTSTKSTEEQREIEGTTDGSIKRAYGLTYQRLD
jgi:hypothetical protein